MWRVALGAAMFPGVGRSSWRSSNSFIKGTRSGVNRTTFTTVAVDMALWVFSIVIGLAFAFEGAMKLVLSKRRLALLGVSSVDESGSGTVIFVGLTEISGGLAIIVPAVLGMPSPLAATAGMAGLIVVILGAAVIHARRREPWMIILNMTLVALTAVALWERPVY